MDLHCEMIMDQYREQKETFLWLKDYVISQLQKALSENGILVSALEARVKEENSLAGKLELKGYKYKSLADITDILGARIVTFYADEVDKIASLVEQMFEIDWSDSVDKRKMLASDQFGYMSLHYICSVPESMYKDDAHPEINKIRFEIQMRTALQHVWATAYHDTGYKSDVEVPKEYIRALSRLAGVLEIADEQFSTIIKDLEEYRRKVRALVKGGNFDDLELNGDTFESYMELNPFSALNEKISAINRAEIQEQNAKVYLDVFSKLGFKTLGDIEKLKAECSDAAYKLASLQISGTDIDIISSTIGLQNLCIVHIVSIGGGVLGLKSFFDTLYGERSRNMVSAKRVYAQAGSINIVPKE